MLVAMNKSYAVFLVLIAVGLGAMIYAEANTISALNQKVSALNAKEAALRAQADRDRAEIKDLQDKIAVFREESDSLRKKLAGGAEVESAAAAPGGNAPAAAASGGVKGAWMKNLAKMYTDPEMKKSMKAQQALGIRMIYGDLFKKLGLSPQESEQLADILAERQMEISGAAMAAMTADGEPDPNQSKKITDATQHYNEQLKATLGDANYAKFQDYEKTMGDRFMMQQYDGQFATAGAPLESAQREALLNIMQEERQKMPDSPFSQNNSNPQAQLNALQDPNAIDQFFAQQEELNSRVLARARQTLSADQIAAFVKIQQQILELQRSQMKMSQGLLGK
jgi:hypothetical protein